MNMRRFLKVGLFLAPVLLVFTGRACAEEPPNAVQKQDLSEEVGRAFEKAMHNVEEFKAKEEESIRVSLKEKLKASSQQWLDSAKQQKDSELDKLADQKWELFLKVGPWFHYDYYLRSYEYIEGKSDITKAESFVTPYKGYFNVMQILYAERRHPANTSSPKQFLYKVTIPLKATFEYREDKFVFVNVEEGQGVIEQGWPEEVWRKVVLP